MNAVICLYTLRAPLRRAGRSEDPWRTSVGQSVVNLYYCDEANETRMQRNVRFVATGDVCKRFTNVCSQ